MDRHLHGEEPPPKRDFYEQPPKLPVLKRTRLDALLDLARSDARYRGLTLREYLSLPIHRRRF
jgi:hypothetical protein